MIWHIKLFLLLPSFLHLHFDFLFHLFVLLFLHLLCFALVCLQSPKHYLLFKNKVNSFVALSFYCLPHNCKVLTSPLFFKQSLVVDWSKLKAFADGNINMNQKLNFDLGRIKTAFSLFYTMFSKGPFLWVVKSND